MSAQHRTKATVSFGTYTVRGDACQAVVAAAINAGYRCIDTATVYRNEDAVGAAIRESAVPRTELHVTTKLAPHDQTGADAVLQALRTSLEKLGLDYVDCYLMHWPGTAKKKPGDPVHIQSRVESWRGFLEAKRLGLAREIGVCNFLVRHFESIETAGLPLPEVHQLELHPLCRQQAVVQFCRARGIAIEAYSPLASGDSRLLAHHGVASPESPAATSEDAAVDEPRARPQPAAESSVDAADEASRRTAAARAALCWSLEQGFTPICRATKEAHMRANLAAVATPEQQRKELAASIDGIRLEEADLKPVCTGGGKPTQLVVDDGDVHFCWFSRDIA